MNSQPDHVNDGAAPLLVDREVAKSRPSTPTYAQVLRSPPRSPVARTARVPCPSVNREDVSSELEGALGPQQATLESKEAEQVHPDEQRRDKGKQRGPPGPVSRPITPPWLATDPDRHPTSMFGPRTTSEYDRTPSLEPQPDDFRLLGNKYDRTADIGGAMGEALCGGDCSWDDFITDGIGRDGRPLPGKTADYSWRARKRMRCETPSEEREGPVRAMYEDAIERSGLMPMPYAPPPVSEQSHEPPPVWIKRYATASRTPLPVAFTTARQEQQAMRDRLNEQTAALAAAIERGSESPPPDKPVSEELTQASGGGHPPKPPPPAGGVRRMRSQRVSRTRPRPGQLAIEGARLAPARTSAMDVDAFERTHESNRPEHANPGGSTSAYAAPAAPALQPMPGFAPVPSLSHTPNRGTGMYEAAPPWRAASNTTAAWAPSPIPSVLQPTRTPTPFPAHAPPPYVGANQGWAARDQARRCTPDYAPLAQYPPHASPAPAAGSGVRSSRYEVLATLRPFALQGVTFTPTPEGGFPQHDFGDPEQLLWGLSREFIADLWAQPDNSTVLFQIHGEHYPSPARVRQIIEEVTTAVRVITGEAAFRVLAPEPVRDERGHQLTSPTTWALVGLSPGAAGEVVTRQVISCTAVTFYVYERAVRFPRFLVALGGFTDDRGGEIMQAVWATFNGPRILPAIIRLAQTNPALADLSPEDAASAVISSLAVRVQTMDNGNVIASVYCESPTDSVHLWRQWRDAIAQVPFRSFLNRTGIARAPSLCEGCHSVSHPTHLCPHPAVAGWNGPPVQTHTRRRAPHPTAPPERRDPGQGQPRGRGGVRGARGGRGAFARGGAGPGGHGTGRGPRDDFRDGGDESWKPGYNGASGSRGDDRDL